jgi:HEPN domain-containing protein
MNEQAAKEWLTKSWHSLSTAELLFRVHHYTDIIAVDVHYSCEKTLKALLAYQNRKIPKSHDLVEIYKLVCAEITIDELGLLKLISSYHIEESYPTFSKTLPPEDEIKEVLEFAQELFARVCKTLSIDPEEVKR